MIIIAAFVFKKGNKNLLHKKFLNQINSCNTFISYSVDTLKKCADCRLPQYCNKKCQRLDWKNGHRYECEYFTKIAPTNNEIKSLRECESIRLALRVYLLSANEPQKTDKPCKAFNGENMNLDRLVSHEYEIAKKHANNKTIKFMLEGLELIHFFFPHLKPINRNKFFTIFCKTLINAIGIGWQDKLFGRGLYMACARFNHDCRPNCVYVFKGLKIEIRCTREFDDNQEDPSISYIPILAPTELRRNKLLNQYYFHCKCTRCENDSFSFPSDFIDKLGEFTIKSRQENEYRELFFLITSYLEQLREFSLNYYTNALQVLIFALKGLRVDKQTIHSAYIEYLQLLQLIVGEDHEQYIGAMLNYIELFE